MNIDKPIYQYSEPNDLQPENIKNCFIGDSRR